MDRQPNGTVEDFQLLRDQLDHIRSQHKGKTLPSVHVLGDFNFREIVWPARLSKSGSMLSQSEGMLLDIMDDHGLEQMIPFPTCDKNTLDLILTSLPGQFQDIAELDSERAEELIGQFSDAINKTEVPLTRRSAPFMDSIVVSTDGLIKLLKGLNPSKALGPEELHPRVLKELVNELSPVFAYFGFLQTFVVSLRKRIGLLLVIIAPCP